MFKAKRNVGVVSVKKVLSVRSAMEFDERKTGAIVVVAKSSDSHLVAREVTVSSNVVETVEDVTLGGILGKTI
jgi:hypothetical protein